MEELPKLRLMTQPVALGPAADFYGVEPYLRTDETTLRIAQKTDTRYLWHAIEQIKSRAQDIPEALDRLFAEQIHLRREATRLWVGQHNFMQQAYAAARDEPLFWEQLSKEQQHAVDVLLKMQPIRNETASVQQLRHIAAFILCSGSRFAHISRNGFFHTQDPEYMSSHLMQDVQGAIESIEAAPYIFENEFQGEVLETALSIYQETHTMVSQSAFDQAGLRRYFDSYDAFADTVRGKAKAARSLEASSMREILNSPMIRVERVEGANQNTGAHPQSASVYRLSCAYEIPAEREAVMLWMQAHLHKYIDTHTASQAGRPMLRMPYLASENEILVIAPPPSLRVLLEEATRLTGQDRNR